jgi:hypothetical protein
VRWDNVLGLEKVVFGKIVYWFKKKVGFCLKGEGIFKGKE